MNTNKTLEALEKQVWPSLNETDQESYLITECHRLRKIPLKDFEIEDFRILIGQDIGLKFLIPLGIDILRKDILAEGDNYPGDLLANILSSDNQFWKEGKSQWKTVCELYEANKDKIKNSDLIWDIKKNLKEYYTNFKEIY